MAENKNKKIEYTIIETVKQGMSQMFNEDSKVIPYTTLKMVGEATDVEFVKSLNSFTKVKVEGISKGRGFAGGMKRWGFAGGPATHGQKDRARSLGSIGTQGQGRVIKGKKMPGHMGTDKISMTSYYISYDENSSELRIKGGVPGARNSKVYLYFAKSNEN